MVSKRSVGFAVVMSLVLCGSVIWLVVNVWMEENDKTAQAETYEYNGWTYEKTIKQLMMVFSSLPLARSNSRNLFWSSS